MKKAKVSKYGQWKYPGEDTIIPNANGSITMKGVPYPVLGIDDLGNQQMMMPGMDYQFPGNSVYEIPMAKNGGTKKVKIKSLPKAQNGIDWEGFSNPELARRARAAGWDNVEQYKNANWAYNTTAPGTPKADLPKFPTRVGPTKEAAVLDANQKEQIRKFAEEHPYRGSYPNDPAGLPSVPIFETAFMAPVALNSMAGALGTELLGTGVTAGNIVNPAFAAHGIYNFANPNSDFRQALSKYNSGNGDWRDVAFEGGLNGLNFLGAKALPGDIKAFNNIKSSQLSKSSPIAYPDKYTELTDFYHSSNLPSIGSEEQYLDYINSTFPNHNVVFQGANDINKNSKWYALDRNYVKRYGDVKPALINTENVFNIHDLEKYYANNPLKNQLMINSDDVRAQLANLEQIAEINPKELNKLLNKLDKSTATFGPEAAPFFEQNSFYVPSLENVHKLGSEQDIAKFKEFITKKSNMRKGGSLSKAQYGNQKDVERSWSNSGRNSNMDIISRGNDTAPFLFTVNTDVIDVSNPNGWSWKNAPTLEPVTLDLNDPNYNKYKQWETVYNLDQQYMPWLVNRLNDPSIPLNEKSHSPNWLPGSNRINEPGLFKLNEIYDSRFLEEPYIKNNYDLSLLNDGLNYGDLMTENQYDFVNESLPIWALTVDKDSTARDRKFNYLHQFFEIPPPTVYLKGKDLKPTTTAPVDIQPQLQNMAPLADGSKVQRVTINTPQGDMVRVQDPKTKKFIRWENVSGEAVDFDDESVGDTSSDFPQIQKSKSRPSFEYGGSLPKAQTGVEAARQASNRLARRQQWLSRNPRNAYYTDIDEFTRANQAEEDSLNAAGSTYLLDMMLNNQRRYPSSFRDPRLGASYANSPRNRFNPAPGRGSIANETIQPQRVRYETVVDRLNIPHTVRVNDYKWPETHAVYKEKIKPKMIEAKPFIIPQIDIQPQLGNIPELPIPKGSKKQRVIVNTPQGDMVRVQDPKTKNFIRWEHTSGESVDFEKKPTGNATDDFPEMRKILTPSFSYGGVPRAQAIGVKKPNFNQTLNIPLQFQQAPNFMDVHVAMPQNSGLGDFTTHRVPSVYDAVRSGNPSSMEEAVNKYLGYPMDKAYDAADRLAPEGEDPIDSFRHPAAAMYTQQAIKDKVGVPILGDALGFLGANASGIGHEVSTLFKDERPWDIKLREAGEDAVNNFAGSVVGLLPGTQDEKANLIYNMSLGNWLPDGIVSKDPNKNMYLKDEQGNVNRDSAVDMYNRMFQKEQGGTINEADFLTSRNNDIVNSLPKDMRQVKIKSLPKAQSLGSVANMMQQVGYKPINNPPLEYQMQSVGYKNPSLTPSVPLQMQSVGYKSVPEFDAFQELEKTGFKEPASVYNEMGQFPQKLAEAFAPIDYGPFSIPEDYYTRLMQEENGVNTGLKEGKYYQYPSHEKGTDTIGYGHKLTEEEEKANKYKDGLTKDEAIALMRNDVQEHLGRTIDQYTEKFGKGSFDKLHPDLKVLALDFVYNGIPITEFPNFFGAANKYSKTKNADAKQAALDEMLKQYVRHDDKGVPLGSRNEYTKGVLMNLKQTGGLAKAQTNGNPNYKTSFDVGKSVAENIELNRRANAMGWNSVADYEKSGWGYNPLKQKQQELINNPEAQKFAIPVENRDQLYANRTTPAQQAINQVYYALSNPVEAAGHAMKYGYVPQGNVGNYGTRHDGDAFSDVTQIANPFAWGNAAYRLSHDLTNKDSWTTGGGALNMGMDFLESIPLLGEISAGSKPALQAIARSPLVSGLHDLAASPRSYGPSYLQTLKDTGKNIVTRTGEAKNIMIPPKASMNDASLYDAAKSEQILKYIYDENFLRNSDAWDVKYWNRMHEAKPDLMPRSKLIQRIANKLDYPVDLSNLGEMRGGFGTVVPTTHDPSKLVKFGVLGDWEAKYPGIFKKLDEMGNTVTDPYIGLPYKSHIFPDLQLPIAHNPGPGSLVQVLKKVPGSPLFKYTQDVDNLNFLKANITEESIQNTVNRLRYLQENNLGIDWQNPDNFLFDPATGEVGIVDIAAMPKSVLRPTAEGSNIRWFNTLGVDYGDIYEKAMGAVIGDASRAAMPVRPFKPQVDAVRTAMGPNYRYIDERSGYPEVWFKNPHTQQIWESALGPQKPRVKRGLMSELMYQLNKGVKKDGGTALPKGKKKQPGFQVLTDANGKYVFVKT